MIVEYAITRATENVVIRLIIGPSPRQIRLPATYSLTTGRGVTLADGVGAVIFAYGPVMLHEALGASERLASEGFTLSVVNMPWLNRVDRAWLRDAVRHHRYVFVLDDHSPVGGLGDCLLNALNELGLLGGMTFRKLGVKGHPACGTPEQVLTFHALDSESIALVVAETAGASIGGSVQSPVTSEDGWAG